MPWESVVVSAVGPTGPVAAPMPTAAPKTTASPRPKVASFAAVFMGCRAASAAGHLVTGLLDGGGDGGLVDRRLADDRQPAAGQVDVDGGDAGDLRDLLGHRGDAVAAGHAGDRVGGGAHGGASVRVGLVRSGRGGRWRPTP